jgi:hypothetical protein
LVTTFCKGGENIKGRKRPATQMVAGILFLISFFNGWFLILRNGDFSPFLFFIIRRKRYKKMPQTLRLRHLHIG